MIALDNGDKIRGDASAATVVDYTLHGIVGTTVTQLADGQLAATIGDLYTAGAAGIAVTSIILVNTDTVARTVNLYLTPSAGTARRLIPKDMSLGIGFSLTFDGQKITVMDASGNIQTSNASMLDNTAGGTDSEVTKAPTSNVMYDHAVATTGAHSLGTMAQAASAAYTGTATYAAHTATDATHGAGTIASVAAVTTQITTHAGSADPHTVYLLKQMAENDPLLLDAALSATGQYSGIAISGTSNAALSIGQVCYIVAGSTRWGLAAATVASGVQRLGMCVGAATGAADTTRILLYGNVSAAALTSCTLAISGSAIFISNTAGSVVSIAPSAGSSIVRVIGHSIAASVMFFAPDGAWVELK